MRSVCALVCLFVYFAQLVTSSSSYAVNVSASTSSATDKNIALLATTGSPTSLFDDNNSRNNVNTGSTEPTHSSSLSTETATPLFNNANDDNDNVSSEMNATSREQMQYNVSLPTAENSTPLFDTWETYNDNNNSSTTSRNDTNSTTNLNATAFDLIINANKDESSDMLVHEFDMRFPIARPDYSFAPNGSVVQNAPIRDQAALWPNAVVPYVLHYTISHETWFAKLIRNAMDEWESKTCIRFRKKAAYDRNYVDFQEDDGCNADVGMIGGKQIVSLGNGCRHHSVVLHELGHVLGFWHEQNRPDRDNYIKIIRSNILRQYDFAFHKYSNHKIDSLGVPYDYKSIMHYSKTAFSKNGKATIVPVSGKKTEFGNNHLSALDIRQANLLYKCPDKSQFYPSFPSDFLFTYRARKRHYCTRLMEPHDRMWWKSRKRYLCVKPGGKAIKLHWSHNGAMPGKRCTRITNPNKSFYRGWGDNYLCVPKDSPYRFLWSVGSKPRGFKCMEWRYDQDTEWGRYKYLCSKSVDKPVHGNWSPWSMWSQCTKKCGKGYQKRNRDCNNPAPQNGGQSCVGVSYKTRECNKQNCRDLPNWPEDFTYRYHQFTPYSTTCIRTFERSNYFHWTYYYFCSRYDRREINMKWSDHGPIRHMKCVQIDEPRESPKSGWNDNYLCVPKDSPYNFQWSHRGPISGLECVRWLAKKGRDGWNNNYLCAPRFRAKVTRATPKVHGGWSAWTVWSKCSKSCDTGRRMSYRLCTNPAPRHGGRTCQGPSERSRSCKIQDCPKPCGAEYNRNRGSIRSPPIRPGETSCTWTITVQAGHKIELTFQNFFLGGTRADCRTDYVVIRDGRQATAPFLRKFCTTRNPAPVYSSGNMMWITLQTSNNVRTPHFYATWMSVPLPTTTPRISGTCGGVLTGDNGDFSSPNFPKHYPRNIDCVWKIQVPLHKVLKLQFLNFELEDKSTRHNKCTYDYVAVRDGTSHMSPLIGQYCGAKTPAGVITAFTNSLWLKFHSDSSNARTGFKATYYTERRNIGCNRKWRHFVSDDGTEYCYLIRRKKVSWQTALNDCRKRKSDLLSIATSKEQWFVRNELMAETKYYELWMGYNDRGREGRWTWSDRTPVKGNFSNWAGGDPNNGGYSKNEDCGVLKPDGKWNDFPCNFRFMYICKKKVSKTK